MDMSKFIVPKSDQLNADDLISGPMTVTIERVTGNDNADQPVSVHLVGQRNPYKPCKSMRRLMVAVWGKDASQYGGHSMTLYRDPKVRFGGMDVGGIRISHMSHLSEKRTMALTETRGKRAPYTVHPLKDAPQQTQQDPPGSIVTTDDFRKRLQDAAEQGTKALEAVWKDRNMAPLREQIKADELAALKETAAGADSFNQPNQEDAGGGYDGV